MGKILNFGSLNLDHVYQVPHFVKPGETLASTGYACHLGGKGLNQSAALALAGADVYHAGKIGTDGRALTEMLNQYQVNTENVIVGQEKTGHAIIQVDAAGQNSILLFGGANRAIEKSEADRVLKAFSPGDTLVLQNETNVVDHAIRAAKEKGMRVVLNPSPITRELLDAALDLVDLFILNEVEAEALTGTSDKRAMGSAMARRYPHAAVLLTLGSEGSEYHESGACMHQDAFKVHAVDTTAAGDTFLGYFVARTAMGETPAQALRLAAAAAALAVTRAGAAQSIPSLAQAREFCGEPYGRL